MIIGIVLTTGMYFIVIGIAVTALVVVLYSFFFQDISDSKEDDDDIDLWPKD